MSQRSAGVFVLHVHPRNHTNKLLSVSDFDGSGADLLTLMRGLLVDLPDDALRDEMKSRYVSIESLDTAGRRLTITADVGLFATPGHTKNVDNHQIAHTRGDRDAATVSTRLVMLVPESSKFALLFFERVGLAHAGTAIVELFTRSVQAVYAQYMVKARRLTVSEAWLRAAELKEVSAAVYSHTVDPADAGLPTAQGRLVTRFVPPSGTHFPSWVWERLHAGDIGASDLFAIDDLEDDTEVTVVLEHEGRQKSFVVGKERLPTASYPLSDSGEPMRTVEGLWTLYDDIAVETFETLGSHWSPNLAANSWTPEQLAVRLDPAAAHESDLA